MSMRSYDDNKKRGRPWKGCSSSGSPAHGGSPSCTSSSCSSKGRGKSRRQQTVRVPGAAGGKDQGKGKCAPLRDLTAELVSCGAYEEYRRWREGYRRWREGEAKGACGEGHSATTEGPLRLSQSWRDAYRNWRQGGLRGARGEMEVHGQRSDDNSPRSDESPTRVPPIVYDVVAGADGKPACVPSEGPPIAPISVEDFPPEAVLTVRVFRFFEDRGDERQFWEKGLLNVNSGSIFWLPWHLEPLMHSKAGAKYGRWFTIHYVQVLAKHFNSAYQMCNEGYSNGAKTFGSSSANKRAVTGQALPEGYFWYVSPAKERENLRSEGWQHLERAGPFDGDAYLKMWHDRDSSMNVRVLQDVLAKLVEESSRKLE